MKNGTGPSNESILGETENIPVRMALDMAAYMDATVVALLRRSPGQKWQLSGMKMVSKSYITGEDPKPFVCPDCRKTYESYWDGNDCSCGSIHLCNNCIERHVHGKHTTEIAIAWEE